MYPIFRLVVSFVLIVCATPIVANNFYYDMSDTGRTSDQKTELGAIAKQDVVGQSKGLIVRLMEAFGLDVSKYAPRDAATAYVRDLINTALGLVSFIALAVLVYGFYQMFFSDQEEGAAKAKKYVVGSAIALFIMFFSYVLIDFIYFIFMSSKDI